MDNIAGAIAGCVVGLMCIAVVVFLGWAFYVFVLAPFLEMLYKAL